MTKSNLELTLGTLGGLPCAAGRSLLEHEVTGDPRGNAHREHGRGEEIWGANLRRCTVPAGWGPKPVAQVSVQTGCLSVCFGAVVVCRAGSHAVSSLCGHDQCVSSSSYAWTHGCHFEEV